jgi:thermospermine synthase
MSLSDNTFKFMNNPGVATVAEKAPLPALLGAEDQHDVVAKSISTTNRWLDENVEEGFRVLYEVEKQLASTVSEFQTVELVDLKPFGRSLVIDGLLCSSRLDEFVYHESLVHPSMLLHPTGAKTVFIGGGGEGSTAREVLRHHSVEKCVMVDIDGVVVDFCRKHLEENTEAFADPRLELIIDDAKKWIENSEMKFDVIIMDLCDPLEGGPCYQLYTTEFYATLKSKLNPGGIMVTQSNEASLKFYQQVFSPIHNTLKSVFDNVIAYSQFIDSFLGEWGWNMALTAPDAVAPKSLSPQTVDALIAERIQGDLKFLDGQSWLGLWALTKQHREMLKKETCVMSLSDNTFKFMNNPGVATVAEKAPLPALLGAEDRHAEKCDKNHCLQGTDVVAKKGSQCLPHWAENSTFATLKDGSKCEALPLRDAPSHAHQLAPLLFQESAESWKHDGYEDESAVLTFLEESMANGGQSPCVWICRKTSDGTLLGSVTLDEDDMTSRPNLGPWLANIVVVPEARGLGVGRCLTDVLLRSELAHKSQRVYLWTEKEEGFFTKMGFKRSEPQRLEYAGAEVTLMHFDVQ